jgi:hypothetical protein
MPRSANAITPGGGGGGGGSGGGGTLTVANLTGGADGVFDFSGGGGGAPGGGGGSGGVLNVYWLNGRAASVQALHAWYDCLQETGPVTAGEAVWDVCARRVPGVPATLTADALVSRLGRASGNGYLGVLRNFGGDGTVPGLPGSHGVSLSVPACDIGEGGALCLPCQPGQFKNTSANNHPCEACLPGTFSNVTGASNCTVCDAVSIAPSFGQAACQACGAGFLPDPTHTTCSLCQPGYGAYNCRPCPAGSSKNDTTTNECTDCQPGTFAANPAQLTCQPCT